MTQEAVSIEPVALTTADGVVLQGQVFGSRNPHQRAVLIAGGLGIAQRFYRPLAGWLAQKGHRVMTFDLRGIGASRSPAHRQSLRGLDADMLTWARRDFPAAVNALSALAGGAPIGLIGHSLGAPVLTPLFGYFPGKALRMVGDLPAPAMRQWSRWCRHPEFAWGAEPDRVLRVWAGSDTSVPSAVRVPMRSGQCSSKLS